MKHYILMGEAHTNINKGSYNKCLTVRHIFSQKCYFS